MRTQLRLLTACFSRRLCVPVGALLVVFVSSACSSLPAVNNDKRGLFDVFSELEDAGGRDWSGDSDLLASQDRARRAARGWQWPIEKVSITSMYGKRGRQFHEGIDLRARTGTSVFAAADGVVMYSGNKISGYGNMVVVKHSSDLVTVYAHHSRNLVKKGQKVRRGQKIALSGSTGRSSGPHLHFEVRRGEKPLDPMMILPEPGYLASGSTAHRVKRRGVAAKAKSEVGI